MKKIISLLCMLLAYNNIYAQVDFSTYYEQNTYSFNDDNKVMRSDLFTTYKSQFNLGASDEMEQTDEGEIILEDDGDVWTQARYIQKHKGYAVDGQMMNVMSKCGVVLQVSGTTLEGLDIDNNNILTEGEALDEA